MKSAKNKRVWEISQQANRQKVYTDALLAKVVRRNYLEFERTDFTMEKHIYDEKNGLHYTLAEDGMYYPDLELPEQEDMWVGKYGLLRETYLKEHRNSIYMSLFLSGKLNQHLLEVNEQAQTQVDQLITHWVKLNGCNEIVKANNQMEWVGRMNNYKMLAEEIVMKEIICI